MGNCAGIDWASEKHDVLIEDAAAASDPCFGCGLSLTLRDVRVLRDRLTSMPDFAAAADVYAASMAGSGI